MTIILFLIDTSGSMNQRTHYGAKPTLLDVTKETVEKFLKVRQRDATSRGDRYMLLTFDEVPFNVKSGWKENHSVFMNELKNLSANGMTTFNTALKNAFDYLNINRMQTGIDTYGQGRCPYYMEPTFIIVITDGCKYSTTVNVQHELNLPMNTHCPGSEFTAEPFRWDQRLFSIVLRLSGSYNCDPLTNGNGFSVPSDDSPLNLMCEVTGGRSFCVTSLKALNASLEQLALRLQNGVMIQFEKHGNDPVAINDEASNYDASNRSWTSTRNLIYVRSNQKGYPVGHWPIPEAYWPDPSIPTLKPRTAHPIVKFTCSNSEPTVIDNLPFDKYELDPSPLTQYILSRKQPNVAWQVYVFNSQGNSELGQPFGYLKASTSLTCVNFFILPYNYPVLLPLLDELFRVHQGKPSREWRQHFDNYLKGMPLYYSTALRRAIQRMGANSNLVPENLDVYLNVTLNNIIKKHKSLAKMEYEKLTSQMSNPKLVNAEYQRISTHFNRKALMELYCSNPLLKKKFSNMQHDHKEFNGFIVRYKDRLNSEFKLNCYRNLYDIPRYQLLDQSIKLHHIFFQKESAVKFQNDDQLHNLPVSQMGNYQEYVKKLPTPLREIDPQPTRQHMFGNPFKLDKKNVMMIDETDIDMMPGGNSSPRGLKRPSDPYSVGGSKSKRKQGPLPKDFPYRVTSPCPSPSRSPPFSPNSLNSCPLTPPLNSSIPNNTTYSIPYVQQQNSSFSPYNQSSVTNASAHKSSQISCNSIFNKQNKANVQVNFNSQVYQFESIPSNKITPKTENSIPSEQAINKCTVNNVNLNTNTIKSNKQNEVNQNGTIIDDLSQFHYRRFTLSPDEKNHVRKVMKLVHSLDTKDHFELINFLSSFKGLFADYLLHEALYDAHRFKRNSLITLLSSSFGAKVDRFCHFVSHNLQNKTEQKKLTSNG